MQNLNNFIFNQILMQFFFRGGVGSKMPIM
jgi:hypothetical protein